MLKYFVANWKMHMLRSEAMGYCAEFKSKYNVPEDCVVVFLAPATCLQNASIEFEGIRNIHVGAQNCHWTATGAHTGEVSPEMIQDCGATWVVIGHSERRLHYGETLQTAGQRASYAIKKGLNVVFCVGETLEQFEQEKTKEVIETQLRVGLSGMKATPLLHIAYEPVWAIGTGKAATPEIAEEIHLYIKEVLDDIIPGAKNPVLYGGSTNPENVSELMAMPSIDGVLVGGASLNPTKFCKLIEAGSA